MKVKSAGRKSHLSRYARWLEEDGWIEAFLRRAAPIKVIAGHSKQEFLSCKSRIIHF